MKIKENFELKKSIDFVLHEDNTVSIVHSSTHLNNTTAIAMVEVMMRNTKAQKPTVEFAAGAYRLLYRFNLLRFQWKIINL